MSTLGSNALLNISDEMQVYTMELCVGTGEHFIACYFL